MKLFFITMITLAGCFTFTKDPAVKFSIDCTDENGKSIKASDPRYELCLARAQNSKVKDNNTNK